MASGGLSFTQYPLLFISINIAAGDKGIEKALHNFSSTQTPLLTDVSNIDKKDGADIKAALCPICSLLS